MGINSNGERCYREEQILWLRTVFDSLDEKAEKEALTILAKYNNKLYGALFSKDVKSYYGYL
mgnify:FL=1